jgi:hypothetical protein
MPLAPMRRDELLAWRAVRGTELDFRHGRIPSRIPAGRVA